MGARERKGFLSGFARQAVMLSAGKCGIPLKELRTEGSGRPIPENNCHWSLSHKPLYVAGVAATLPVGIDVEPVRPVDESLFRRVADEKERALICEDQDRFFFRLWTAKEAVVKMVGGKYSDIFRCRVAEIIDDHHLVISFADTLLHIEHRFFDGHVASLVTSEKAVSWQVG